MKVVEETADGVLLRVKVTPKARKEQVRGIDAGFLKIAVAPPPERGRANEAAIALLAKFFGVSKADVVILSGETSKEKQVKILGLSAAEVDAKLQARH